MAFNTSLIVNKELPVRIINEPLKFHSDEKIIGSIVEPHAPDYIGSVKVLGIKQFWEKTLIGQQVNRRVFIDEFGTVYFGTTDGKVYKVKGDDGKTVQEFSNHSGVVSEVYAVPSQNRLLTAGWGDNTLKSVNMDGGIIWTFGGHTGGVNSVTFDPATYAIFTGSSDNTVKKIGFTSGSEVWNYQNTASVLAVRYYNNHLYFAGNDGGIGKLSQDGSEIWKKPIHNTRVSNMKVKKGFIYSAEWSGLNIKKTTINGDIVWTKTLPSTTNDLEVTNESIFVTTTKGEIVNLDLDGNIRWTTNFGDEFLRGAAADRYGNFYFGSEDSLLNKVSGELHVKGYRFT